MTVNDIYDSDDETEIYPQWQQKYFFNQINDYIDIDLEEKKFMIEWNKVVMKE